MNWYDVLEVSPSASPQVIRAAYKSLMQRYHPDKGSGEEALANPDRASLLAQAYAVLSDAQLRQAYDEQLHQRVVAAAAAAVPPLAVHPRAASPGGAPVSRATAAVWPWAGALALALIGAVVAKKAGVFPFGVSATSALPAPAVAAAPAPEKAVAAVQLSGIVVAVRMGAAQADGEFHSLTVPSLTLQLGAWQTDKVARQLQQPAVTNAVRAALGDLSYEQLIAVQGQATVARAILEAANAALEPPNPPPEPGPDGAVPVYGVQSVVMRQAYSVH